MATKSMGTLTLFLRGDATQLIATMATVEKSMLARAAKMRSIGLSMAMYITAPLALIGAGMAKSVMKFDDAMNKSVAIMGAQGREMRAEMEKTAISLSKTTSTTATEMAEAYFFLASAGLTAKQSIAALSVVEKFAVAGSFDLAKATTLAMDSQAALGMKSKDAITNMRNLKKVTDILVGANTLANATTEQFAIALTHGAGAAMKNFGIQLEDGIAILAAYADQGIKAERAGNMFSRMIRLMSAGVIRNEAAWKGFGVNIYDAENNLRPLTDLVKDLSAGFADLSGKQVAYNLHMLGFKARSQQAIFPLLGMTEKTREFMNALEDMGGMTEEVASYRLQSFNNQLKIAKNHITAASLSMKDSLVPILEKLNEVLKKTGEWWENQTLAVKDATVKWSIIAALVGPGLIAISFALKMVASSVGVLSGAITILYTILSASLLPALKGIVSYTAAVKVGFTGLGATSGVIFAGVVVAVLAAAAAFTELYYAIFKAQEESKGWGSWMINNFEWIAVAGAYMAASIQLLWADLKRTGKDVWSAYKLEFMIAKAVIVSGFSAIQIAWGVLLNALEVGVESFSHSFGRILLKIEHSLNKIKPGKDWDFGGAELLYKDLDFGGDVQIDMGTERMKEGFRDVSKVAGEFTTTLEDYNKEVSVIGEGLGNRLIEIEEQFAPVTEQATAAAESIAEVGEVLAENTEQEAERTRSWLLRFWDDLDKKWTAYKAKTLDLIGSITDLAIASFDQMGNHMADMLMGNEVNWRDFARNILAELITLLTKALLVYAVLALFPGLMGVFAVLGQASQVASQAQGVANVAGATQQATQTNSQMQGQMMAPASMDAAVAGGGTWMAEDPYHTGGIVGKGPLKSDERIVVAQTGEAIISKDQLRDTRESEESSPSQFKIVNVLERKEMLDALSTAEGEKMVVNIMRRNKSEVSGIIG